LRDQLLRFLPQVSLDLVLTLTAVQLLTGLGVQLLPARVLAGGSNATINYVMYRWWTFRPSRAGRPQNSQPVPSPSTMISTSPEIT
jgi:putative flippase GtrA